MEPKLLNSLDQMADAFTTLAELVDAPDDKPSLTDALMALCRALNRLGVADAATPMGAMEMLSLEHKTGMEAVASSLSYGLSEIASAIKEGFDGLSNAVAEAAADIATAE